MKRSLFNIPESLCKNNLIAHADIFEIRYSKVLRIPVE